MSAPRLRFVRAVTFSASHAYAGGQWGREFVLEAHIEGSVDPLTGMIVNLVKVDQWLNEVTLPFRGRHINEVEPFQKTEPTPERLVRHFFEELQRRVLNDPSGAHLSFVRLHEDNETFLSYPATS